MITKEWWDARWKLAATAALVLLAVVVSPIPTPYEEISSYAPTGKVNGFALNEMWGTYSAGGFLVLVPLAALLGVGLVSGEVDSGTMFLLLSRPVGRTRALLTKYAVCAGTLLVAAIFGASLLSAGAAARGYPFEQFSLAGAALSALLLWLGALFVLGVALLASVVFRNLVASVAATVLTLYVVLSAAPQFLLSIFYEYQFRYTDVRPGMEIPGVAETFIRNLDLVQYWTSERMFIGEGLAATSFLVCLIAAMTPLLLALWLFRRKAY